MGAARRREHGESVVAHVGGYLRESLAGWSIGAQGSRWCCMALVPMQCGRPKRPRDIASCVCSISRGSAGIAAISQAAFGWFCGALDQPTSANRGSARLL